MGYSPLSPLFLWPRVIAVEELMAATLEREIKLRVDNAGAARAAILAMGALSSRGRRLQQDALLDTADGRLRNDRLVLRLRREPGRSLLTFKGPVQPASMKVREELEVDVADGDLLLALLARVGFTVWFRYEKLREEFTSGEVTLALDETPIGTFLEIEGDERGVADTATALGRGPAEYVLDSYRTLFVRACGERGVPVTDMLFDRG